MKFFRARGMEDIVFMPYDVYGRLLLEDGRPITGEKYLDYLAGVLPDYYMQDKQFAKYREALLGREAPQPGRSYGW
jgi:hypothetical protein